MPTNTHTPPFWEQRLLDVVGGKITVETVKLLDAWARAEGGTARWNPLNTTYPLPGATDYNTAGVKNYRHPTEGVCATALTLINGFYPGILGALQAGKLTARQIVQQHGKEFDTWGTGAAHVLALIPK